MLGFSLVCAIISVVFIASDAFKMTPIPTGRSTRLQSTSQSPNSIGVDFKQSLNGLIKLSVAGSALFGLSTAALAADKAPVKSSVTPPPEVPAIDKDGFLTNDSGLKFKDTKIGDGELPQAGDSVKVHYTGWLDAFETGKKFDSSYDRNSPIVFKVGVKQVIAGWDEALLGNMKVGGKKSIIIPPALGYGARGAGGVIPPEATLYFNIELVAITARAPVLKLLD